MLRSALPDRRRTAAPLAAVVLLIATVSCGDDPTAPPVATSLAVEGETSLRVTGSATLTATVLDQDGRVVGGSDVAWQSLTPAVASVEGDGTVTALAEGAAIVRATAGSLQADHAIQILPEGVLAFSQDTITLTTLGGGATVGATLDGESVPVSLSVASEHRWNQELAVASTAGATVTARGAGVATLHVHSPAGASGTVAVRVAPERPYISGFQTPVEPVSPTVPLLVRGWALDRLVDGDVLVDGMFPAVTLVDSATAALGLAAVRSSVCHNGLAPVTVQGDNVVLLADPPEVRRARQGEVDLPVGVTLRLTTQQAECLKLGPGIYTLALYDSRYVPKPTVVPPYTKTEMFTVRVADISENPSAAAGLAPASSSGHLQSPHGDAHDDPHDDPGLRMAEELMATTTPWREGDVIDHTGREVVRVVNDYFVLAVEDPPALLPETLDSITSFLEQLETQHWPWLTDLFGGQPEAPNGQFLILVDPLDQDLGLGGFGGTWSIALHLGRRFFEYYENAYHLFIHEIAHAFDLSRRDRIRATVGAIPYRERWHIEGLADHIAFRVLAERFGYEFGRNLPEDDLGLMTWLLRALPNYRIENGYSDAASLMLRLTDRLAEATGWSWTAAHDTVALATATNRWGCTTTTAQVVWECDRFDGLYDVLTRHFGPGWDPIDEILLYALAQSLDGEMDNPELQNPHIALRQGMRLRESGLVHTWTGAVREWEFLEGSIGRFTVSGTKPAALSLSATSGDVKWMVVRTL